MSKIRMGLSFAFFVVLTISLSLILSGCEDPNSGFYDPYYGTQGLYMEFTEGTPPAYVYEGEEFPIGVYIENDGAADISNGILSFVVEEDYLTYPRGDNEDLTLRGRSTTIPEGDIDVRQFFIRTNNLDPMSKIHNSQIIVNACYQYSTRVNEEICIDPDVFGIREEREKSCEVTDLILDGQGGPLAVTEIKTTITKKNEDSSPIYPLFEIKVKNLGTGRVIDYTRIGDYCGYGILDKDMINRFEIRASIAGIPIECRPKNPVELMKDDEAIVLCTTTRGLEESDYAYKSILDIELDYGYSIAISEMVEIRKNFGTI